MQLKKTIALNIVKPTKTKQLLIDELIDTYRNALEYVVSRGDKKDTRFSLQSVFYDDIRKEYSLHSQIANDLFKDAVPILRNGGRVGNISVPFNVPRSGKFSITKKGNPIVSFVAIGKRIAIPIAMDGAYRRFQSLIEQGYDTTFFRFDGRRVYVTLKRDVVIRDGYDAVIGIDVGVKRLATVSIINREGKILKQLYFGDDMWDKQRNISIRRSKLRSYADKGSKHAIQKLRKLRRKEKNYVRTRSYQVAHQIVNLAKEYNAFISIENLKHLNRARGNRKSNRKSKRMPYATFRVALESVAWENGILVETVNPKYTSQKCSRCGNMGIRNGSVFHCPVCGYEGNADRNASVNIGIRAGLKLHTTNVFFKAQIPDANLSVNAGAFADDGVGVRCLQHFAYLRDKPTTSVVGG